MRLTSARLAQKITNILSKKQPQRGAYKLRLASSEGNLSRCHLGLLINLIFFKVMLHSSKDRFTDSGVKHCLILRLKKTFSKV